MSEKSVDANAAESKAVSAKTADFSHLPSVDDPVDTKYNMYLSCKITSTMDMIVPRLYLSDDVAARNKKLLDENKITHILNLTTNIANKYDSYITYKKLIILDFESQNIRQYFEEAFEFIDNALKSEKNAVLVHCNAGEKLKVVFNKELYEKMSNKKSQN